MLTELKFVQGSIAKKDLLPALTHFVIEKGTVRGYNGIIALCSPIPFDIACKPKAEPLVKAISNCNDVIQLALTSSNRLSIKSGKFKAFIDCVEGETPHVIAEGESFPIDGKRMFEAFKSVYPFIGNDASRPWCEGVLLKDQSAYATNNVILVEFWVGAKIPFPVNVPKIAIKEMLRIGEPPTGALIASNSITFLYSGDRWIRSQLLDTRWPDIEPILSRPSAPVEIDSEIFKGLEVVKPFLDTFGRVFINDGVMSTHSSETEGASFEIADKAITGIYNHSMLALLNNVVKTIDWSTYPRPCAFFGDYLRGVIIGLKS